MEKITNYALFFTLALFSCQKETAEEKVMEKFRIVTQSTNTYQVKVYDWTAGNSVPLVYMDKKGIRGQHDTTLTVNVNDTHIAINSPYGTANVKIYKDEELLDEYTVVKTLSDKFY